jgi:hypothetical protein
VIEWQDINGSFVCSVGKGKFFQQWRMNMNYGWVVRKYNDDEQNDDVVMFFFLKICVVISLFLCL